MNDYSGSNLDDFLAEEGILEEVSARAYKRLLARQVQDALEDLTHTLCCRPIVTTKWSMASYWSVAHPCHHRHHYSDKRT